jgi:HPt (histidine-containing phosphotransfer) domain-containing protein
MNDNRHSEIQALRVSIAYQESELARAKKSKAPNAEIERIQTVLMRLEQSLRELSPT